MNLKGEPGASAPVGDDDTRMSGPEPLPPRSAHIALVVSSSLCAQAAIPPGARGCRCAIGGRRCGARQ